MQSARRLSSYLSLFQDFALAAGVSAAELSSSIRLLRRLFAAEVLLELVHVNLEPVEDRAPMPGEGRDGHRLGDLLVGGAGLLGAHGIGPDAVLARDLGGDGERDQRL